MGASINDIARVSGVSIATVSRVFNQRSNVREAVRRKVIEAAKELGYSPKLTARKDCIAILAECYETLNVGGYDTMLLASLVRQVSQQGLHLEIIPFSDLDVFQEKFFQGVISTLYSPEHMEALRSMQGQIPVVSVNSVMEGVPAVCSNDRQGMQLGVQHLTGKGHERIGLIVGHEWNWGSLERRERYREALVSHGLEADDAFVQIVSSPEYMMEALGKLMRQDVTAIIVANENLGIVASYGLNLMGKRIPGDVSLLTYEYATVSRYCYPAQTALSQNYDGLSENAVSLLQKLTRKESRPEGMEPVLIDYTLIERDSTGVRRYWSSGQ